MLFRFHWQFRLGSADGGSCLGLVFHTMTQYNSDCAQLVQLTSLSSASGAAGTSRFAVPQFRWWLGWLGLSPCGAVLQQATSGLLTWWPACRRGRVRMREQKLHSLLKLKGIKITLNWRYLRYRRHRKKPFLSLPHLIKGRTSESETSINSLSEGASSQEGDWPLAPGWETA